MKKSNYIYMAMLVIFALLSNHSVKAQEETPEPGSSLSVSADLVSRYIWRGQNLGGNAASIQPGLEVSLGNSGLALGAWGAYSLGEQTNQEADLYLSYTSPNEMFSIGLADYYFPDDNGGYDYFNYDQDETGHLFEATLSFNGTEKLPLSILFAINVAGADTKDDNGDIVYSKYLEIGYSKTFGSYDFGFFVGAALDNGPDGVDENGNNLKGFYGQEDANVVNLGLSLSKEVQITDKFSLPISGSFITNPDAKSVYMVFGVSF